jgi:hypothetical protein
MIALLATAAFFLLHLAVARWSNRSFTRNLKLSRGVAAAVLVATGAASLAYWWALWPQGFLVVHESRAEAWAVEILAGHLLADLFWLGAGRVLHDSRAARDLVLHHLLGLVACATAWGFCAGYALVGVVLLTEVLPVLTGVGAWARNRRNQALEHGVLWASLAAVALFRIPLWIFLGVTFAHLLLSGAAAPIHHTVAPIFFPALLFVLVLDLYWCRSYVRLLRDFPRRGIRDVSIDPLAPLLPEEAGTG